MAKGEARNWRRHPRQQIAALRAVLKKLDFVDVVLNRQLRTVKPNTLTSRTEQTQMSISLKH